MSHPYTDQYGYPLSSTATLLRMRRRLPIFTGAQVSAVPGLRPLTIHQAAEMVDPANDNDPKADGLAARHP